jgi:hypothetical protein
MPYFSGTGPDGSGAMTGRGLGHCGGGRAYAVCYGRGRGGYGTGRRFGWSAVGYGPTTGVPSSYEGLRDSLEARKAFLSAELARTETLLSELPSQRAQAEDGVK